MLCLLLSLTFIFLSLLLPTPLHSLAALTIEPTYKQYSPVPAPGPSAASASTVFIDSDGLADTISTGDYRRPSDQDLEDTWQHRHRPGSGDNSDNLIALGGNEGEIVWYGLDEPSIWIGPMQICSKAYPQGEVVCTSASEATFHAANLPLSLGKSLAALPTRATAPVLLLVTGISIVFAVLAHLFHAVTTFAPRINLAKKRLWKRSRQHSDLDPDEADDSSVRGLVLPTSGGDKTTLTRTPHLAFLCVLVLAAIFSIASAGVEGAAAHAAQAAFDENEAERIGMLIRVSAISYLLPFIPVLLTLSGVLAYLPIIERMVVKQRRESGLATREDQEKGHGSEDGLSGAAVSDREGISGLFPGVRDSGKRLSDGSTIFNEVGADARQTARKDVLGDIRARRSAEEVDVNDLQESPKTTSSKGVQTLSPGHRDTFGVGGNVGEAV